LLIGDHRGLLSGQRPDGIRPFINWGILIVARPSRLGNSNCRRWGVLIVAHQPGGAAGQAGR
jgi:hypothetical protein